jgi:hypothetical protein
MSNCSMSTVAWNGSSGAMNKVIPPPGLPRWFNGFCTTFVCHKECRNCAALVSAYTKEIHMSKKWLSLIVLLPLLMALCSVSAQNVAPPAAEPVSAAAAAPAAPAPVGAAAAPAEFPAVAPRAGAAPAAAATEKRKTSSIPESERQTTIIRLLNMRCSNALTMLEQLLDGEDMDDVKLAVDEATNSLVLRGRKQEIDEIQALLLQLDKESPTTRQSELPTGPRAAYPAPTYPAPATNARRAAAAQQPAQGPTVYRVAQTPYSREARYVQQAQLESKLMQEYTKLEDQTLQIAREYRTSAGKKDPDNKQLEDARKKLAELVTQAFDQRQRVQAEEVKQLKERLEKIEGTLNKRTDNRQQIIDKRVAELLEEDRDLRWDTVGVRTPLYVDQAATTPPAQLSQTQQLPMPAMQPGPSFTPTVVLPSPVPVPPANAPYQPNTLVRTSDLAAPGFGTTTPFSAVGLNLMNAESELAKADLELKEAERMHKNNAISKDRRDVIAENAKQTRARRDFLRRELETQLRLLELDVQAANARLEATQAALSTAKTQSDSGVGPVSEVAKMRGEAAQAEYGLQKAKALLDLHRSAAPQKSGSSDAITGGPLRPIEQPQLATYQIGKADPATVKNVLSTLLAGSEVRLDIDPVNNKVIALARPSEHRTIIETLKQLEGNADRIEVSPATETKPVTQPKR